MSFFNEFIYTTERRTSLIIEIADTSDQFIEPDVGPIVNLSFSVYEDAELGDSTHIELGAVLSDSSGFDLNVQSEDGMLYFGKKGDVNWDCQIDVLDVVATVSIILELPPFDHPTQCQEWAADFTCDDKINVIDIVNIVNCILGSDSFSKD